MFWISSEKGNLPYELLHKVNVIWFLDDQLVYECETPKYLAVSL